ncbi:hypothetical protein [Burkholderia pyrrocinia]|uniref:hypothetical protein n=1 Tax=Burkholderia pyrrocinia TaxID=60550 RepID=UPI001589D661|nr:hypothetical protein [Burkholderia pyrrocinia]
MPSRYGAKAFGRHSRRAGRRAAARKRDRHPVRRKYPKLFEQLKQSAALLGNTRAFRANPAPTTPGLSTGMHFHLPVANMTVPRFRTTTPFDMTPVRHAVPDPGRFAAAAMPGTRGTHRRAGRPCHP